MSRPFYVTDLEVFPNMILAVVIDLSEYMKICKDLDKVPIYDKKEIVDKVPYRVFTIYDDKFGKNSVDDSFDLISFMSQSMFLGSFNGLEYDDIIINYLLSSISYGKWNPMSISSKIYDLSQKIIYNNKYGLRDDYITMLKYTKTNYIPVDVMKVFALDKVRKSLKQTLINLNWYSILDYDMPPPTDKEKAYYKFKYNYGDSELAYLNQWDRVVTDDHLSDIIKYCFNDVTGTCEIIRKKIKDISIRMTASIKYKVNLMSSSRSNMADRIFIARYCELAKIDAKTLASIKPHEYSLLRLAECVPNDIVYNDPKLYEIYNFYRGAIVHNDEKEKLTFTFKYQDTTYTFARGGIHSVDYPAYFDNTDYYLIDADVQSFYPFYAYNKQIAPVHLNARIFGAAVIGVIRDRIAAKKVDVTEAEVLKIVINSGVFGKLGFKFSPFYDRKAMFKVTIGGQLTIFMAIEAVVAIGGQVISANTDGFVSIIPKDKLFEYFEVCRNWEEKTNLKLEYSFYEKYIRRDVNNYIAVKRGTKPLEERIKRKGDLNKNLFEEDLQKGYDAPIVAIAIEDYFLHNVPIMDTLKGCTKIENFLMTTKPDASFNIVNYEVINSVLHKTIITKNNRYYVSNTGSVITKTKSNEATILKSPTILGNRLVAKHYVTLYNQAFKKEEFDEFDVKYSYYYERCSKIINLINFEIKKGMKKVDKYIKDNIDNYTLF